ncbi:DUF6250 domain-containing protein [Siphonobacter sp. SORGH_AS_0500]|uniref:DUF6250 domain-containing protein n=1 Tax=Siphonobacter sp. SORGH_AS_0500 TaxID=1864824 RepID=UPI0038F68F23
MLWQPSAKGNYVVEYTRTILMNRNVNDRLSELNQNWMVHEPCLKTVSSGKAHELLKILFNCIR